MEAALAGNAVDHGSNGVIQPASMLGRIASALGEPEAALFGEASAWSELDETCEMLRVWHALQGAQARRTVLNFAHSVAAKADASHLGMRTANDQSGSAEPALSRPIEAFAAETS